jgi:hypothetical protein
MTQDKLRGAAKPAEGGARIKTQHFFAERQNLDPERAEMRMRESGAEAQIEELAEKSEAGEKKDKPPQSGQVRGVERDPRLNDPDATPGTGMLPPIGDDESNMQPSS